MKQVKVIVIGSGFSGLCMGIKLKEAGLHDFLILEKAERLGGTWRENTYPGAECDIPSALYSYSFEPNAAWEFKWSGQKQILKYQNDTAIKHGLIEHLKFNQTVISANYDEDMALWNVQTKEGQLYQAQHFVTAVGQLHHSSTPDIDGAEQFKGVSFHSAHWDHSVELEGKRVGVIGNAASAVQFIPEIAKKVKQLTVFQRSANWMLPKIDRPYTKWEHWLWDKFPPITKLYRLSLWLRGEWGVLPAIRGNRLSAWLIRCWSLRSLKKHIKDDDLIAKLTPTYNVGAKRILFSDNYYPALARENVYLDVSGIEAFTPNGIKRKDGIEQAFDVVIYGTGFKTNPFFMDIAITGKSGQSIRDAWREGAQAYLGVATHGFPNFHMMYGPNTNLGHNSIIIMIETQANYIIKAIQYLDVSQKKSMEVLPEAERAFNVKLQARLSKLAFSQVAHSWYLDGNKVTNNWAGGTLEYMRRLSDVNWADYRLM